MEDNLMEALKQSEKQNGKAQVVKTENGKVIGYCGVMQKGETSFECLCKGMIAAIETKRNKPVRQKNNRVINLTTNTKA